MNAKLSLNYKVYWRVSSDKTTGLSCRVLDFYTFDNNHTGEKKAKTCWNLQIFLVQWARGEEIVSIVIKVCKPAERIKFLLLQIISDWVFKKLTLNFIFLIGSYSKLIFSLLIPHYDC